jgi:hypothetical protein
MDMKMNDVFNGNLAYEETLYSTRYRFIINDEAGKSHAATWYEDQADLMCEAINNHERLVEESKMLRELLQRIKTDLLMRGDEDSDGCTVVDLSSSIWLELCKLAENK